MMYIYIAVSMERKELYVPICHSPAVWRAVGVYHSAGWIDDNGYIYETISNRDQAQPKQRGMKFDMYQN